LGQNIKNRNVCDFHPRNGQKDGQGTKTGNRESETDPLGIFRTTKMKAMATRKKKMKMMTLDQMKDKDIGKIGTPDRDKYEFDLRMEILGEMIKSVRKERKMTQEQLGELIGVQKSQISKLERSAKNVTIETILKVFNALKANIKFSVQMNDSEFKVA